MRNKIIVTGSIVVSLAVILILAVVGYNALKDRYEGISEQTSSNLEDTSENTTSQAKESAVDFTFYDKDGNTVQLSDYYGKPIILNFWASWCGPCKAEMPEFQTAYEQYGDDIQFIMVNLTDGYQETEESAKALIADSGYTFPVYFDKDMDGAQKYAVYSIPVTFVIDGKGSIVTTNVGMMDGDKLTGILDALK